MQEPKCIKVTQDLLTTWLIEWLMGASGKRVVPSQQPAFSKRRIFRSHRGRQLTITATLCKREICSLDGDARNRARFPIEWDMKLDTHRPPCRNILIAVWSHVYWPQNLSSFSGELRTQKLKSHLIRTQSLNVLPLKPGVGQYTAMPTTHTAKDFFLANFYPSGPFTCIFPKHLPSFSSVSCS